MKAKIFTLLAAILLLQPALNALTAQQEDTVLRDFLWGEFIKLPKNERPKIGITLSAGATRGFSHIGALEVIRTSGLPIDYMSGTSMGCIVGSFFAAGLPQDKLNAIASNPSLSYISKDLSFVGVARYLLGNKLFSSANFEDFLDNQIGSVNFEDLKIPFSCVAADIKTGEKVVFASGPVSLGVRSSMNLPGIFEPVQYRQRYLVDGGVVDYMPVDVVKAMGADWVLALFALPDYSKQVPTTILGYILRTGDLRGAFLTENSEKNANFLIASRVGDINGLDASQSQTAVEIGAKSTYKSLADMKENLLLFSVNYVLK